MEIPLVVMEGGKDEGWESDPAIIGDGQQAIPNERRTAVKIECYGCGRVNKATKGQQTDGESEARWRYDG
jgi:hypothetical protein